MASRLPLPPTPILVYLGGLFVGFTGLLFLLTKIPSKIDIHWYDLVFWALVIVWAVRAEVRLPVNASISHLFVVALAVGMLMPPWVASIMVFIFFLDKDLGKPSYPWFKDLFNRSQYAIATGISAIVWLYCQSFLQDSKVVSEVASIFSTAAVTVTFFGLNVLMLVYVIHLASGISVKKIWYENFSWLWKSYLILSPVALLLAKAYQTPLIGGWGGFTVLFVMMLLYFSRFYWDEKVKLEEAFDSTVEVVVRALDAKDPFTRLHSERVAAISTDLAMALGLDEADVKKINYAARIHDIGKVAIPDSVLLKPARLTDEEFALIKSHPQKGLEVLKPMLPFLSKPVQAVILQHHERWDGLGYPHRSKGEDTHLWARIVCVADSYEAMTAGRKYSNPKTPQDALNEVIVFSGRQFDPSVVQAFEQLWLEDRIWRDREVFLSSYTSPLPFSESPLPLPSSEPEPVTSQK